MHLFTANIKPFFVVDIFDACYTKIKTTMNRVGVRVVFAATFGVDFHTCPKANDEWCILWIGQHNMHIWYKSYMVLTQRNTILTVEYLLVSLFAVIRKSQDAEL